MMIGAPRAVGDLVTVAVPALRERLLEHRIRRAWPHVVGPDVARRALPHSLVDGCLSITVDNSPWLHELNLRAAELTARLHDRFAGVRSIRFVLGTLPADVGASLPPAESPVPVSPADAGDIEAATAAIHDPDLAAAARRLMTAAWRTPRSRGAAR